MDDVIHFEVSCGKFLSLIPTYDELRGINHFNYFNSGIQFYDSYYESLDESLDCNRHPHPHPREEGSSRSLATGKDDNNCSSSLNSCSSSSAGSLITSGSVSLMFHQMTSQINDELKSNTSGSMNCSRITSLTDSSFIFNKLLVQNYNEYLMDASNVINDLKMKCSYWVNMYDSQFVLETLNYSGDSSKNSSTLINSNGKLQCKLSHDESNTDKVTNCKDVDEEEFTINESTSPPPTIDSPSSSSETTCTDSGVFVNLNSNSNLHSNTSSSCCTSSNLQQNNQQQVQVNKDNLLDKLTMNNESSLLAQSKVTCANNDQPTQLTLANKVNIESSSVPLILSSSSPQPLISSTSNCSTIILSPFTTTTCKVTIVDCKSKNSYLTLDDDTNNATGGNCSLKTSASIITGETTSVDETSSSISDVTLMINHRNSNNCSPVTSVDELHSMNHESCAYNSSGTGSTNGQITCDNFNLISSETSESIIGPFLMAILTKVESMVDGDLITNLQLTGIISHLASYPVPLLRSYFLSSLVSYQKNVKTFFTSLEIARRRIINETSKLNQSQFDSILCTSRCYLMSRDLNDCKVTNLNYNANSTTCTSSLQLLNRYNMNLNDSFSSIESFETSKSGKSSTSSGSSNRRKSLKEFLFRSKATSKNNTSVNDSHGEQGLNCPLHGHLFDLTQKNDKSNCKNSKVPKAPILESLNTGTGYRYINRASYDSNSSKESDVIIKSFASEREEKIMLAALVFEEFMKEISAICHEHSIASIKS